MGTLRLARAGDTRLSISAPAGLKNRLLAGHMRTWLEAGEDAFRQPWSMKDNIA